MKRILALVILAFFLSGCAGYVFPNYANVNNAIKTRKEFVGFTGYELRKTLGAPTDIQVAYSDEMGLIQILIFATARGTISVAVQDNVVVDVDYQNRFKK